MQIQSLWTLKCCKAEITFSNYPCSILYIPTWCHTVHSNLPPRHFFACVYTPYAFSSKLFFCRHLQLIAQITEAHISTLCLLFRCSEKPLQMLLPPYFLSSQTIIYHHLHHLSLLSFLTCFHLQHPPGPTPYFVLANPYWCSVCMGSTYRGLLHWTG